MSYTPMNGGKPLSKRAGKQWSVSDLEQAAYPGTLKVDPTLFAQTKPGRNLLDTPSTQAK